MASARVMPGVCGVLVSRLLARMMRRPCVRQSGVSLGIRLLVMSISLYQICPLGWGTVATSPCSTIFGIGVEVEGHAQIDERPGKVAGQVAVWSRVMNGI